MEYSVSVQQAAASPPEQPASNAEIDLKALAEEIVALLKKEVWQEQDRRGGDLRR